MCQEHSFSLSLWSLFFSPFQPSFLSLHLFPYSSLLTPSYPPPSIIFIFPLCCFLLSALSLPPAPFSVGATTQQHNEASSLAPAPWVSFSSRRVCYRTTQTPLLQQLPWHFIKIPQLITNTKLFRSQIKV